MKKALVILLLLLTVGVQAQYNPIIHTVTNKALGIAQDAPTDARSKYYATTAFGYRLYKNTAEVLAYLNLPKYRGGQFPIYVNVGGVLQADSLTFTGGTTGEYWFKSGLTDSDLVGKTISTLSSTDSLAHRTITKLTDSSFKINKPNGLSDTILIVSAGDPYDSTYKRASDSINAVTGYATLFQVNRKLSRFSNLSDLTSIVAARGNLGLTTGALWDTLRINLKQDVLLSGINIKTINGASVLGSGNLTVTVDTTSLSDRINAKQYDLTNGYNGILAINNGALFLRGSIGSFGVNLVRAFVTANRTATFPDKDGTVAYTSDLATSGSYTPTLTNTLNITNSGLVEAMYTRVGNIVHVAVRVGITPTGAATTQLTITLPVTTSFSAGGIGNIIGSTATNATGFTALASTTTMVATFVATTTTSTNYFIQFDYTL